VLGQHRRVVSRTGADGSDTSRPGCDAACWFDELIMLGSGGDRCRHRRHGSFAGFSTAGLCTPSGLLSAAGVLPTAGLLRAATRLLRSLICAHQCKIAAAALRTCSCVEYS
jgi:hypothetical protein